MPNQIIIEPVADSTKILTHVMGTAEGVIVTRYTDGSDIYIKKWDMSGVIPETEEAGEPGYRKRVLDSLEDPIATMLYEQVTGPDGVVHKTFTFVVKGLVVLG